MKLFYFLFAIFFFTIDANTQTNQKIKSTTPLIQQNNTTKGKTISSEEIAKLPKKNIKAITATPSRCFPSTPTESITFRSCGSSDYYIDGVRVNNSTPISTIQGIILDEVTKEPLIGTHITVKKGGNFVHATISDFDGFYRINLPVDIYDIEVSYMGYQTRTKKQIDLKQQKKINYNVQLTSGITLEEVVVTAYQIPHTDIGCLTTCGRVERVCEFKSLDIESKEDENKTNYFISQEARKVKLYPNPATSLFTISSPNEIESIHIFNSNGKLIYQQNNLKQNKTEIQITHWPAGLYLVNSIIDGEQVTEQLVIIGE